MKEISRINLKATPNQIEYYIDTCVYINFGQNFKFVSEVITINPPLGPFFAKSKGGVFYRKVQKFSAPAAG